MSTLPVEALDHGEAMLAAGVVADSYAQAYRPFVVVHNGVLFIAIKGTTGLAEWANNARIALVPFWMGAKTHAGFLSIAKGISTECSLAIRDHQDVKRIVFCGHSMGGAVACLLATWLAGMTDKPVRVYQFGAPRPGDEVFRELCERVCDQVWTFMMDQDVVPHAISGLWYGRPGTKVWMNEKGHRISQMKGGLATLRYWLGFGRDDLKDHGYNGYLAALMVFAARAETAKRMASHPDPS